MTGAILAQIPGLLLSLTFATRAGVRAPPASRPAPAPAASVAPDAGSRADWVWWEAERPTTTNFPAMNPFAPAPGTPAADALSGGAWIGATDPGKMLFAEYEITAPHSGDFTFYARKFWSHGPFRWHFDNQAWRECGRNVALLDEVTLRTFVVANWVELGVVNLAAGKHLLRIELTSTTGSAAFDCFVLTGRPFKARGKLKPDDHYPEAESGWFTFDPELQTQRGAPAALDLRGLNESFAGMNGFIGVKDASFIHEKTGAPVRFWGVNAGHGLLEHDPAALERFARHLAKLGVNLVRLHGPLWREDDVTEIDDVKLGKIHRLTAALKRQGIYLELSTYFPVWLRPKGIAGLEGYDGDKQTFGLPFFSPRFQDLQRAWWKRALSAKSHDTGLSLLEDPTLALIEIQNEDSLFFWTFAPYENVPAPQMEILERRFGVWVARKYGGIGPAFAAWKGGDGDGSVRGDDAAAGRVGFMPLWQIASQHEGRRAQDTAQFLAELQHQYYQEMRDELKTKLGFRGSVTGSNWVTADGRRLGPLDKWSNTGADFMDRHGYYGGPHVGERASYSLSTGDRYRDASALRFDRSDDAAGAPAGREDGAQPPLELPFMDLAYGGKPSIISEINWSMPNRYRAEMAPLCAAYGALQGSDAFIFFATDDVEWSGELAKFSIADPAVMGQFPATALLYRKGLVKAGPVAVHLAVNLQDLYSLAGLPTAAARVEDAEAGAQARVAAAGKSAENPAGQASMWQWPRKRASEDRPAGPVVDPLFFLAGRVEVDVADGGRRPSSTVANITSFVDRQRRVVRSATSELSWDWGRGLATINAPQAQGATGFLGKAGSIALDDITISSPMEYGSVLVVSMDGLPLRTSKKILVQVMSEEKNSGWSAPELGARDAPTAAAKTTTTSAAMTSGWRTITDVGHAPILVKNLEGRLWFKRRDARALRSRPLDLDGYDVAATPEHFGGSGELDLLPKTLYYLVE